MGANVRRKSVAFEDQIMTNVSAKIIWEA